MLVKTKNDGQEIDQFPYTIGDLHRDHPGVSFPSEIPPELLAERLREYDVYIVAEPDAPGFNSASQICTRDDLPKLSEAGWVLGWTVGEKPAEEIAADLQIEKEGYVRAVDDLIANIYSKWMRFESEYREREAAARRFKDAGYSGEAGIWVTAFANSAGKTVQQAVDLIIAQADQLRTALEQLGALRMTKYAILSAVNTAAAQAKHDEIINQANTIAAQLG